MLNNTEHYTCVKTQPPKKRRSGRGTWKAAFADFAIAMMAFFLLMWILHSTSAVEKTAIAEYFMKPNKYANPSSVTHDTTGTNGNMAAFSKQIKNAIPEQEINKLEQLKQEWQNKIENTEFLKDYKEQIYLDITSEGLRIQIFDNNNRAMFPRSSPRLNGYAQTLLANLAVLINQTDNRISIAGHTDAMLFQKNDEYTNWELSADRANAARSALVTGGLAEEKVARVVGLSSTILFDNEDPGNFTNRRISIIVLSKSVDTLMQQQEEKLNLEIKRNMQIKQQEANSADKTSVIPKPSK